MRVVSIENLPEIDEDLTVLVRVVTMEAKRAFGDLSASVDKFSVRCVFWHDLDRQAHRSWENRQRFHDALLEGLSRGTGLAKNRILSVLFSWVHDLGQPRMLAELRRSEGCLTIPAI